MTWSSRVIDELVVLRQNGVEQFERAWAQAIKAHPPSLRDMGPREPTLFGDASDEVPMYEWVRRACEDAWKGRRPVLGKLVTALEHFDAVDEHHQAWSPPLVA